MKKYEKSKEELGELSRTEEKFRTLAILPQFILDWFEQNCGEIAFITNEAGKILFVSKSAKSILGYKNSELLNTSWKEIIALENLPSILQKLKMKDTTEYLFELSIRNKQNEFILFESLTSKVYDETNNNFYYISILKKLTQYKNMEAKMFQAEKMSIVGQFAAGLAHEIRNPLTSLKGFLQLLQIGGKGKEAYYKIMIDEIDRIEAITSELLFLSKPITTDKQKESIRIILTDVIVLLKSQAILNNIELKLIQEKDVFFHCNQSQMKQVFINLIKNAVEAMSGPGTIKIIVDVSDSKIKIDVVDEGPGIPAEIIHKLATPFFTTKQTGTGLGLVITKQIIEQHGAKIRIRQNEEAGTTFEVTLPYDPDLN